jgi:hypothetical protein
MVMASIDPRHLTFGFLLLVSLGIAPEVFSRWEELFTRVVESTQEEVTEAELLEAQKAYEVLQAEAIALRQMRTRLLAGRSDEPKAIMDLVLAQIRSNRLRLVAFDPGRSEKAPNAALLKVEVEGKYDGLRTFLLELERSPMAIAVQKAEFTEPPQSGALVLKLEAEVEPEK